MDSSDQNQSTSDSSESMERFIQMLATSEHEVRAFILTMLPHWGDSDELLQRTSVVLWRKFPEWSATENFVAWACQVARLEVKDYLRKQSRDQLFFDERLIDSLSDTRAELADELSDRRDALVHCRQKLVPKDLEIIDCCYSDKRVTAKEVARTLGRPANTVYKALIRIRRVLFECIERELAKEGRP